MKKVDFSQIEVEMIDGKMAKADLQHGENGLGNQIYMQARELKWKDLGRKIYYAEGEVEISEEEEKHILDFIKPWSLVLQEGIKRAFENKTFSS